MRKSRTEENSGDFIHDRNSIKHPFTIPPKPRGAIRGSKSSFLYEEEPQQIIFDEEARLKYQRLSLVCQAYSSHIKRITSESVGGSSYRRSSKMYSMSFAMKANTLTSIMNANKNYPYDGQGKEINEFVDMTDDDILNVAIFILKKPPSSRIHVEIEMLRHNIKNVDFFKSISSETNKEQFIDSCFKEMGYIYSKEKSFVFQKGDVADKFYLILKGSVSILIPDDSKVDIKKSASLKSPVMKEIKIMKKGESFGELAFIDNKPRSASILCKEDCHFGVLDKNSFNLIMREFERKRLRMNIDFLLSIQIFSNFSFPSLKQLYYSTELKTYSKGQAIYTEGDESDYVYFIREGEFQLFQKEKINKGSKEKEITIEKEFPLTILTTKDYFGIEEVTANTKRQNKVICISNQGKLLSLPKKEFLKNVWFNERCQVYLNDYLSDRKAFREKRIANLKASTELAFHSIIPEEEDNWKIPRKLKDLFFVPSERKFDDLVRSEIIIPKDQKSAKPKSKRILNSSEGLSAFQEKANIFSPKNNKKNSIFSAKSPFHRDFNLSATPLHNKGTPSNGKSKTEYFYNFMIKSTIVNRPISPIKEFREILQNSNDSNTISITRKKSTNSIHEASTKRIRASIYSDFSVRNLNKGKVLNLKSTFSDAQSAIKKANDEHVLNFASKFGIDMKINDKDKKCIETLEFRMKKKEPLPDYENRLNSYEIRKEYIKSKIPTKSFWTKKRNSSLDSNNTIKLENNSKKNMNKLNQRLLIERPKSGINVTKISFRDKVKQLS